MSAKVDTVPMDEIPLPSSYGAAELKAYIRKHTVRGLIVTLSLVLLLIGFYMTAKKISEAQAVKVVATNNTTLTDLESKDIKLDAIQTIETPPENTGPQEAAGTPQAAPEAEVDTEHEFAALDKLDRASAAGGNGVDNGLLSSNLDFTSNAITQKIEVIEKEVEPDINELQAVEKEPVFDFPKLKSLVVYPEMAKRANIEGKVVLRVLIDKSGKATKSAIFSSDNDMLNKAALDAIKQYGKFQPAIQNGNPVSCWVNIPLDFKLR